jgi:hypothetical protein
MRKGTHMNKKSKELISKGISGNRNGMFGKRHSTKTKNLIREKSLKQFSKGMPESTKRKMRKTHQKRVFATIGHTFINRGVDVQLSYQK